MDQTAILSKLTSRLTSLQNDRNECQATISFQTSSLQQLFKQVPKRPQSSPSSLLSQIIQLDDTQNTTSLTLSVEKSLLKKKENLKLSLKIHQKCDAHQEQIDAIKSNLDGLKQSMISKDSAITELRKTVRNLTLAESLSCPFSSLKTISIPCSSQFLSKIIGKSGSSIKKIEKSCSVRCDVKSESETIDVIGSDDAVELARCMIENVTLSETRSIPLSSNITGWILDAPRAELLKEMRTWGVDVRIERSSDSLEIKGRSDSLDFFVEKFNNLKLLTETLTLDGSSQGILIGKSGSMIKKLTKENNVRIDISKSSEIDNVEITGEKDAVDKCKSEIEVLVVEMEVVTEIDDLPLYLRNQLMKNSGEVIKNIGKVSECYSKLLGSSKPDANDSRIEYRGLRRQVEKFKKMVEEEAEKYRESEVVVLVSADALPAVVGKKGEVVKKLRKEMGVSVEIDFDSGEVKVQSFDVEKREKAVKAIEEIKKVNHVNILKIGPVVLPLLLGPPGKEARSKVIDEIGVKLVVVQESRDIKLIGERSKVEEAEKVVGEFLEENFVEVFEVAREDIGVLVSGKDSSIQKKLSSLHSVEIFLRRDANTLSIRGKKTNVTSCLADLKKEIFGSDDIAVSDLKVGESKGVIIGKGGAQIKLLESTHGVRIQMLDATNCIRVRGAPTNVGAAITAVTLLIANQKLTVNLPVTEKTLKNLGHKGSLTKMILSKNVTPSLKTDQETSEKQLRLRGYPEDIEEVKRLLAESENKPIKVTLTMDVDQLRKIGGEDMPHWKRIKERCGVSLKVEKGEDGGLFMEGKRKGVEDALRQAYGYFGFCLSEEFGTVEVGGGALGRCFSPGDLVLMGTESGVKIVKDYTTSQLLLFCNSSDPEKGSNETRLAAARKLIDSKISYWSKMNYVMKVERWVLPVLVGKKGATINGIRDEAGVEIDVDQSTSTVTIKVSSEAEGEAGSGQERINKAKLIIEKLIEENKIYSETLELPDSSKGTFIGKGGANIKSIQEGLKDVTFDLTDNGTKVVIKGSEESVILGRSRVEEWIETFEEKNANLSMRVISVGMLVGPKGETIRGLETENNVKINVAQRDREGGEENSGGSSVIIRGEKGNVEKVKVLIDVIMAQEEERQEQRRKEFGEQQQARREERGEEKKKEGARKRLNKKKRDLLDSSKPLDPGEKGSDWLGLLKSNDGGRVEGEVIVSNNSGDSIEEMLNSPRNGVNVPPPPGLGFTPGSKGKGGRRAMRRRRRRRRRRRGKRTSSVGVGSA
ncbi:hypothetical protein TL16_g09943 [Triparma laevis f. inornata]|uniref:K Homology domain-containing protein n=1 Tax=Triparma laevis f. inornata TaxID=1714386 RepID=A0A9W7BAP0_9STRA|nr:hypothetical protein TL16_g09943 [Triparma laevis f. inornata]